ncbi:PREDICTED: LOW QUALITY PROTEIN: neuropeptide CCHamide-2 receptor-like [Trachymyrmex septentrionalis]|uniref:LOW QUALITY PROTEIN: neuropeptide CCHamide-2 receptor-like n=1 Tax=Trachymyrmex septentrionalis TaxID=34720 RepID=UPI00084F7D0B|nr:PREDICTED: LOW QUALITY PROTEIN: neuropeptide CCHamide-2 receptor-like [Trachymyrmex septentrionalis]
MSSEMEYDYEYKYIPVAERVETYIIPVIFLSILIVGVIGNGILILILLRHTSMRNIPNTYVLSLALGDLLVIVTYIPFTLFVYVLDSWPWGLTICKLSEYAKDISIGVSVFTLAALSAERYCAIVNPIRRHVAGLSAKPLTVLTASLIWVLAIVIAMPAVLFSEVTSVPVLGNRSILICNPFPEEFGEIYRKGMVMFKFLAYYLIPLCVIAIFYLSMTWHLTLSTKNMPCELPDSDHHEQIKARKRVGKMVVCFIIIFVICFLPYHIYVLWFHFNPTAMDDFNSYWNAFRVFGFCLSFINSCVNPIALYLISRTFRQKFNKYLCCCLPGSTVYGRNRTESSITQGNIFLQKSRRINETSSSTTRRRTQEFNSTGVFEMGSIESKPPVVTENRFHEQTLSQIIMKRYSSAPCLEDVGNDSKRIKNSEQYADPNTREYLQLALARVLELQREIREGTYVAEIDDGSNLSNAKLFCCFQTFFQALRNSNASGSEEDLTKEILTKVFHDLPGTPSSLAKIIDRGTRWKNHRIDAIHSKRIQLLGFDTCRRMALEFMRTIIQESRDKSCSLNMIELDNFSQNESLHLKDGILANDFRKREFNTHEIQARMLKSLDLHLAVKQRDYTSKLMKSGI